MPCCVVAGRCRGRRLGFVGAEHGRAESLNLAVAATVCLYASATAQGR
jgi:hypothetical protein